MSLLADIRAILRIKSDTYDLEIQDLIGAAKLDLELAGVMPAALDDADALVKRAVTVYCKANFGLETPDAERYAQAYAMLRDHMAMSADYNGYRVTFIVANTDGPVEEALVTFDGRSIYTGSTGSAEFRGVRPENRKAYDIYVDASEAASGYTNVAGHTTITVVLGG